MKEQAGFLRSLRGAAPYINAHRGQVVVVHFGGEMVADGGFREFIHDLALLEMLGVRLVLVHGARPQIEQALAQRGFAARIHLGLRVTDEKELATVLEAVGAVRLSVEALLSMGLPNSPMAGARIRVVSGNFVTARPIGVRDGVDFKHTGKVRRVDVAALKQHLQVGHVVLVSPLGFSPTGEVFNLRAEEVATAIAVEMGAAKLLLLGEEPGITGADGELIRWLDLTSAKRLLAEKRGENDGSDEAMEHLASAIHACRNGVRRTHLIDRRANGGILTELYTRDGCGTMVSADPFEATRRATLADVSGILELVRPMEQTGALVRRSREKLEMEIEHFLVIERDGAIIACAAVHPFPAAGVMELAGLAVHEDYRRSRRAGLLLAAVEAEARSAGATRLFVLTTRAEHWFVEHGFEAATLSDLPVERQSLYNYQRNSKVLVKPLDRDTGT